MLAAAGTSPLMLPGTQQTYFARGGSALAIATAVIQFTVADRPDACTATAPCLPRHRSDRHGHASEAHQHQHQQHQQSRRHRHKYKYKYPPSPMSIPLTPRGGGGGHHRTGT